MKLTKRAIDGFRYEGGTDYRWDDLLPGFGVRVYPSGRKSFVLSYRSNGRKRIMVLGPYGVLTLQQARDQARVRLAEVIEGGDPLTARQQAAKTVTMAELAERYFTEHAAVKKKESSQRNDRRMLRQHIVPQLGHLRVDAVTRQDVAALHHSLRAKRYTANRVLSLLSKMCNLAEKWGLRPDGSNPCRHVERFREQPRERYLSREELGRLATALRESEGYLGVHAVAAIRLLLLTGCRLGEILQLRWEQVDLEAGLLRLPDSKTGAKIVYLAVPAQELLRTLPRTQGAEYVIEGQSLDAPRADLNRPWWHVRKRAGLEDVRLHDLRHSFASVGAGLGLSLPMLGNLLGHKQAATTARYAHLAADPLQEAADRIAGELVAAMAAGGGEE